MLFLRRLASLGRGTCELVTPGEALEASIARCHRKSAIPVDWPDSAGADLTMGSLAPDVVPDLYGSTVFVMGEQDGLKELQ